MNARFFFIIAERSDSAIHLEIKKDLDNIHLASASYITLQDCVPSQKRLADFHIYFSNSAGHGGIVALASYHTSDCVSLTQFWNMYPVLLREYLKRITIYTTLLVFSAALAI